MLFPRYKLAIAVDTGDFLAMDVHEYHCNTPINILSPNGYRLSFVCYLRDRMSECNQINDRINRMNGGNKTAMDWIRDIFGHFSEDVPEKEKIGTGKYGHEWWEMRGTRITIRYMHKRYTLFDHVAGTIVKELAPAWEYAFNSHHQPQEDDG